MSASGRRRRLSEQQREGLGRMPMIMFLVTAGVLAVITIVAAIGWPVVEPALEAERRAAVLEDMLDLRIISNALLVQAETPLHRDGRVDVYGALAKHGLDKAKILEACTSSRSGRGPTWAMIEANDYSRFPYVRGAGPFPRDGKERLFLWDPEARDGERMVAVNNGVANVVSEEEFERLRGEGR